MKSDFQLGLSLPCYLLISFRSPSSMHMFSEDYMILGFYVTLQMALSFCCPSTYAFPYIFIHFSSLFDPPHLAHPQASILCIL